MARVFIAAELKELLPPMPIRGHDIQWIPTDADTPGGDAVAFVTLLSRQFGAAEFAKLPDLQIVANCAVGFDNIDVDAARQLGVVVTNTPDVLTNATADLTVLLILAVARRLKEGAALIAAGEWTGWHPQQLLGIELAGATLGIVGAGRIGQAVARRAMGFGMQLLYADPQVRHEFERDVGARRVAVEDLLAESDVVTLHVPSLPETRGMVNREWFAHMRDGALLVNTARGDVLDEPALLEALESGRLVGAGLDVFPREPLVNTALIDHPRVVALPHLGSATTTTRRGMANLAVENIRSVLAGEPAVTPVPGSPTTRR